jgi:hypothetical protein
VRLILAHAGDAPARRLAARWGDGAMLLTPGQLYTRSWELRLDTGGAARSTVRWPGSGGRPQIEAVVCRLGGIGPAELGRVRPEDREYAAAELTAFLFAWLSACPCPVLNPPGTGSLNGPGWQAEHWLRAAAQAGLPVRETHRLVMPGTPAAAMPPPMREPSAAEVILVAGECLGPVSAANQQKLRDLSDAAGTPLLRVALDGAGPGAAVTEISAWPDLGAPGVALALERTLAA